MSNFAHTAHGAPQTLTLDALSIKPAELAEAMLVTGGCRHLELTSKRHAGGAVGVCLGVDSGLMKNTNGAEWWWRAEIFDAPGWSQSYSMGSVFSTRFSFTAATTPPLPDTAIKLSPVVPIAFDSAIVPFTRAWQELESRSLRFSLSREFMRLAAGLDGYDEDWCMKMSSTNDTLVGAVFHADGEWKPLDCERVLREMREMWLKTPEGFFEAKGVKDAKRQRKRA